MNHGQSDDLYLSMDLSHHIKDQISNLEVMLSDVKGILGKEKLSNSLEPNDFLPKNKINLSQKTLLA
ncbi:hypothetical protein BGK56_14025 [Providencia stuartii]|nr:hypothetical protein BGK56_14025 [Providencia stuartii]